MLVETETVQQASSVHSFGSDMMINPYFTPTQLSSRCTACNDFMPLYSDFILHEIECIKLKASDRPGQVLPPVFKM